MKTCECSLDKRQWNPKTARCMTCREVYDRDGPALCPKCGFVTCHLIDDGPGIDLRIQCVSMHCKWLFDASLWDDMLTATPRTP